jgi:hypothetical protein
MNDNKRAADDAEREKFNAWFKSEHTRMAVSPSFACKAWARAAWQAALSSRADGGKGEAVYQIRSTNAGTWHDVDKERYESTRFERRIVYTAPQAECAPRVSDLTDVISEEAISRLEALMAPECTDGGKCGAGGYCGACKFAECAPREAQPVGQWLRDLRRAHEYLDKGEPFFTGKDCAELADLIESLASPTPERADADTAGAIEPIDILLDRLKSGEDYTTPLHPKKDAK